MPLFKYNEIEINYIKRGRGEPLLMFQGLGQTIDSWTFQIPFFKRKMTVIALDNRGVGGSSRPDYPYTMDMFVDESKALLDYLDIRDNVHLIGVSLGGMIAQNFVLKHPEIVKTITLLATSSYLDPGPLLDRYRIMMEEMEPEDAFNSTLELLFSDKFMKRVQEDRKLYDTIFDKLGKSTTRMQDYKNRSAAVKGINIADLLHTISQPTLILVGSEDKLIPVEESKLLHEKIPNSTLEIFEGYGHGSLLVEDFQKVNNTIWNFIEQHLG